MYFAGLLNDGTQFFLIMRNFSDLNSLLTFVYITYKDYQMVMDAIPSGIIQLIKGHFERRGLEEVDSTLCIYCRNITSCQ